MSWMYSPWWGLGWVLAIFGLAVINGYQQAKQQQEQTMSKRIVWVEGKPEIARTPDGRYINEDGTLGGYERFTDASRAWIVGHPYYSLMDHRKELHAVLERALQLALDEGVNYIDVTHLEEASEPDV